MAQPLTVAFPPNLRITDGWRVSIRAIDASDGSDVTGVRITEALIQVENESGTNLTSGPFLMIAGPGA